MMRVAVFSHCAIDTIRVGGSTYEQIGGAACYCGITARQLGADVDLYSKFGPDFPRQYISESGMRCHDCESEKKTTRFSISVEGPDRTLSLENQCEPISYHMSDADAHIVSPIYCEISKDVFSRTKRDSQFMLVDPQGFLRTTDSRKNVVLQKSDVDLAGVDAVKVNPEEASCMAKGTHDEMMVALQKRGPKYVLLADRTDVSLLVKDKMYSITLPNKEIHDTTGIGDIFCSAFCCTMLKERDFLWALCFAGGAAQAALDSRSVGLQKVPRRGAVQTNASYFYNLVRFRDI